MSESGRSHAFHPWTGRAMNETPQPPKFPAWLGPTMVVLLTAQLGLTWLQGGLLHRQHHDIQGLREDLQGLAESLDEGTAAVPEEEGGLVPARSRHRSHSTRKIVRVTHISQQEEPADQGDQAAKKDLEAARQSAQKAVKDGREIQQKLSLTENARIAGEKAKLQESTSQWQKWIWMGLGAGLLGIVVRNWLRRRG